jgi:RNA polymerase sigma-70 factor (ECF subfamily)
MASAPDFEGVVAQFYEPLYQFAFSLAQSEADACDLTQQTFYVWATKGHQLRDPHKVKTWLFTTLHRLHLAARRRATRFPHQEISAVEFDLPVLPPDAASRLDAGQAVAALARVDEVFRAPVALFYLEDYSYNEIAAILDAPLGTVKSRIARGLAQLQRVLANDLAADGRNQPPQA